MDDEVLITLVQNYEELYNLKHSQYFNHQRRDNIWKEIGKIMKLSGKTCRARWARIRENHRKALNLRKTKSGPASKKLKTPKFDQQLTFLVPYLFDEEGEESDNAEEDYSQSINRDIPSPLGCSASSSTHSATSTPFTKRKKSMQPLSVATVLQDYLEVRKSRSLNNTTTSEDALTKFFLSMAETVKGFSLRDQVEIKTKLFEMVNAVELRMLPVVPTQGLQPLPPVSAVSFNPQSQPLNSGANSQEDPYQSKYLL